MMSNNPDYNDAIQEILERNARTLGQPVSDILTAEDQIIRDTETLALVRAFDRIIGSTARARCIAFVNGEAAWEEHT